MTCSPHYKLVWIFHISYFIFQIEKSKNPSPRFILSKKTEYFHKSRLLYYYFILFIWISFFCFFGWLVGWMVAFLRFFTPLRILFPFPFAICFCFFQWFLLLFCNLQLFFFRCQSHARWNNKNQIKMNFNSHCERTEIKQKKSRTQIEINEEFWVLSIFWIAEPFFIVFIRFLFIFFIILVHSIYIDINI